MTYTVNEILTKSGLPTVMVNGYLLHSKYNPLGEAINFAKKHYLARATHVLVGYGKGYLVDALIEKFQNNEKLIVVDPLISEGLLSVKNEHKKHKQIIFFDCNYINDFSYFLKSVEQRKFQTEYNVIPAVNYKNIIPETLVEIVKQVKQTQYSTMSDIATVTQHTDHWQNNMLRNMLYIEKDMSLHELKNSVSQPIVIASGGPSLTKQLPLLKKYRDNVVLVAAGSTINSLLDEDISPDFVVSIDGTEGNEKHFEQLNFKDAKLVYCFTNHHTVREKFEQPGYLFLLKSERYLNNILKAEFGCTYPILNGGGTVAHYCLSFARFISNGPVAIIGQDLAFTNNETHAVNNLYYEKISMENIPDNYLYVEDYYGDRVLTNSMFFDMKQDFEKLVTLLERADMIFNCTEGGANINGMNKMAFGDFLQQNATELVQTLVVDGESSKRKLNKSLVEYFKLMERQSQLIINELVTVGNEIQQPGVKQNMIKRLVEKVNKEISIFSEIFPLSVVKDKLAFYASRREVEQDSISTLEKYAEINKEYVEVFSTFKVIAQSINKEIGEKRD